MSSLRLAFSFRARESLPRGGAVGSLLVLLLAASAGAAEKLDVTLDPAPLVRTAAPLVTSYSDVVEPIQRAVVSVYSSKLLRAPLGQLNPLFREFFDNAEKQPRLQGVGSGVIITTDGYIVTNNHVVDGADELKVSLPDEREFTAKVVGTDPKTDIAVIKIDATGLPTATLADSDLLRVGDIVFAVGNPLGIGQTVTMGIISATGRKNLRLVDDGNGYENFIQTDAAINRGNSGGALIDAGGRLIGINTAIFSNGAGGNIGIGFAIPVNLAASVARSLVETGGVQRGLLGVEGDTLTAEVAEALDLKRDQRGVLLSRVTVDGPADAAGLQREDVITAIDGKPVTSLPDLRLIVSQKVPGTASRVDFLRRGKPETVNVVLGRFDDSTSTNELLRGVTVAPLSDELRTRFEIEERIRGLVISELAPDSPHRDRLALGMVIVEINRTPITTISEARTAVVTGRNLFLVHHRGVFRYIAVTVR